MSDTHKVEVHSWFWYLTRSIAIFPAVAIGAFKACGYTFGAFLFWGFATTLTISSITAASLITSPGAIALFVSLATCAAIVSISMEGWKLTKTIVNFSNPQNFNYFWQSLFEKLGLSHVDDIQKSGRFSLIIEIPIALLALIPPAVTFGLKAATMAVGTAGILMLLTLNPIPALTIGCIVGIGGGFLSLGKEGRTTLKRFARSGSALVKLLFGYDDTRLLKHFIFTGKTNAKDQSRILRGLVLVFPFIFSLFGAVGKACGNSFSFITLGIAAILFFHRTLAIAPLAALSTPVIIATAACLITIGLSNLLVSYTMEVKSWLDPMLFHFEGYQNPEHTKMTSRPGLVTFLGRIPALLTAFSKGCNMTLCVVGAGLALFAGGSVTLIGLSTSATAILFFGILATLCLGFSVAATSYYKEGAIFQKEFGKWFGIGVELQAENYESTSSLNEYEETERGLIAGEPKPKPSCWDCLPSLCR